MSINVLIQNAEGRLEPFEERKLRESLERANAKPDVIDRIVSIIERKLKNGMTTHKIYSHAFKLLSKFQRNAVGGYSLRRAIMEFGPSGFPFEKLVGEILRAEGYTNVKVGNTVQGVCVSHEVDVIAEKDGKKIMVECKFHNQIGVISDIKTALYVKARFDDISKAIEQTPNRKHEKFDEVWLVTNTKVSDDAVKYARCAGMKAIAWNYPVGEGIGDRIAKAGIHPITCLNSLDRHHKQFLLNKGVIVCKDIISNQDILRSAGVKNSQIQRVIEEATNVCQSKN